MALTISAYKNDTVSSISGTTFNSNGTPFASTDVGRCIVITSGDAKGQMRKIVSYTDTNTVVVDYAWDISPFRDYINAASGSAFTESNPASSAAWTMSSFLDDVDDTTNINKLVGNQVYEVVGTNVITIDSGAFLYDIGITLYGNSSNIDIHPSGYVRFGDLDGDGNVYNGIHFIDTSGDWNPNRSWTNSSSGDAGDLHFYNSVITVVDGSSGDGLFWSLYSAADSGYRLVGCTMNGTFGARIRGTNTILKDLLFYGYDSAPDWQTINPYGTLGMIENINFINKNRVIYWNHTYGGFEVRNIKFSDTVQAFVYSSGSETEQATITGFDAADAEAVTNMVNVSTTSSASYLTLKNPIVTKVLDSSLELITDSYKRVIWNPSDAVVDDDTVTDGDWDEYAATWWRIAMASTGNKTLAMGTTTTPYVQAIIGYKYLPNTLVEPARQPSSVQFTGIPDLSITENTKATVDAYTVLSNGERLYDRGKSWTFDNFDDAFPTKGELLIKGAGSSLDLGAASLVINGSAASALAVNQTGNGTITIDAGTKLTRTVGKFNTIISTGSIKIEDATNVDDWTLDSDVVLEASLNLKDVTITGDLDINISSNATISFDNVTVSGTVNNINASNTLSINLSNGSSITVGDAGTGNGQTNSKQTVPIKVTVRDITDDSVIVGARVFLKAGSGGDLTEGTTIVNMITDSSGEVNSTFNYTNNQPVTGRVRKATNV